MAPARGGAASIADAGADGSVPWSAILAAAVTQPEELARRLGLDAAAVSASAAAGFRVRVPEPYLARIRPGDARDPLLLQVMPTAAELIEAAGFTCDPVGESQCASAPGVLRKYAGRVLLVTTGACAVHCRYCFRRHYPYDDLPRGREWWGGALALIAADPGLEEVLLSGGDPLTLPDSLLARLAGDLAGIAHVRRLRVHTRLPIVIPQRVDAALLRWLAGTRLQPVVVVHANHPAEIDAACAAALRRMREAGITVLNQSVLLAGVNDDEAVLAELSRRLFDAGCLPYYLHALDPVAGAAHFLVADDRARAIHAQLAARLPGYLVPRLVREIPGAAGKLPL